eukprot:COSAG06_NODE_17273_length_951_cov_1.232394_2_plen_160_part_01
MATLPDDSGVQYSCLYALAELAITGHGDAVAAAGAIRSVTAAMEALPDNTYVQTDGCWTLAELVGHGQIDAVAAADGGDFAYAAMDGSLKDKDWPDGKNWCKVVVDTLCTAGYGGEPCEEDLAAPPSTPPPPPTNLFGPPPPPPTNPFGPPPPPPLDPFG